MTQGNFDQTQFLDNGPKGVETVPLPVVTTQVAPKKSVVPIIVVGVLVTLIIVATATMLLVSNKPQTLEIAPSITPTPVASSAPPTRLQEMVDALEPVVKQADPYTNTNPFPPVNTKLKFQEPKN